MSKEKTRVGVHLTKNESDKLKQYASDCGLSVSELVRQLCNGNCPKQKPPKEFWGLMNALYETHAAIKNCISHYPTATENCKEIERLIIDLQKKYIIRRAE